MIIGKVTKESFNSSQIVPSFMFIHYSVEFIFVGIDVTDQSTYVLHLHWKMKSTALRNLNHQTSVPYLLY